MISRPGRRLALALLGLLVAQAAAAQAYFRAEYPAKGGKGPAVLVISGQLGPETRRPFAKDVATLGYNVLLVDGLVARFQVPLTMMAAGSDTYNNCCLIERALEIEKAAKAHGKAFEMTVYDKAEHGYDLSGRNYRADATRDTWKRTEEALKRMHAETAK